ncbi:MAG: class I SAM-dependent methyltransferase [Nanoarchaeota archaeon]
MSKVLEIGSGKHYYKAKSNEEVVHLDRIKKEHVEVVHNLDKYPWPFKPNTFDKVYASHILEHLSDLVKAIEEIYRVAKPNALVIIKVPYFASAYAFQDPTHKHFFAYRTFEYFVKNSWLSIDSRVEFKIVRRRINFSWNRLLNLFSYIINIFPKFYERYIAFIIPSNELYVELKVVK